MYDCTECAARPALKAMLGHDGPPQAFWRENLITKEPLLRCPIRDLLDADPAVASEIDRHAGVYHALYKDGHLLVAGGVADQPARYLAYMQELQRLENMSEYEYDKIKNPDGATA